MKASFPDFPNTSQIPLKIKTIHTSIINLHPLINSFRTQTDNSIGPCKSPTGEAAPTQRSSCSNSLQTESPLVLSPQHLDVRIAPNKLRDKIGIALLKCEHNELGFGERERETIIGFGIEVQVLWVFVSMGERGNLFNNLLIK
ncbi:hypothetical protein CDAR_218451 [Caerostris darwini]|uniref:Uncharacterized protein n=1 Tax=Caerostris darwini TaxID=1538125 RepID=A0AAV4RKP2_9ARAC|nr:hypothetical protein CDAR_218451 [Caerostris darwini]